MTKHGTQTSTSEPRGESAPADDEGDSFDEVPTVANRPNPAAAPAEALPAEKTPGIGAYRMVRPATSDTLTPPAPSKPAKSSRLVIGVARK